MTITTRTTRAAVAVLTAAATVTQSPAAAAATGPVTLSCPGLGSLTVVTAGGGVRAVGLPAGERLVTGPARGEDVCGTVQVPGAGRVRVGVVAAPSAAAAAVPAAVPGAGTTFPFDATIRSYLAGRSGTASVTVFDALTGTTYSYAPGTSSVTASIVKASILGTLLRQARAAGRSLTSTERALATRMIEQSDNSAATSLWNEVGGTGGVQAFMNAVGMPATRAGTGGFWGLTTTDTPDQVRLVRDIAYPNGVLAAADRGYEESLMRSVVASQRWGVTGGVPSSVTVALKNGWLPHGTGWVINSIGHVRGGGRDYAIAVLSSGSPSMAYGIGTVEHLSSMVWSGLPRPVPPADLYGVLAAGGASGRVEVHAMAGPGLFTHWSLHRATALGAVVPADWTLLVAPTAGDRAPDLVAVHERNTASGRVEVHVLSAASGYTRFTRHAATALVAVDPAQWQFSVGGVGDGGADLVAVRTAGTASGRVEVHVLTESSAYRSYRVHASTPVAAGAGVASAWRFAVGDGGDVVGVLANGTASGRTEVHVLSWTARYAAWRLHSATPLPVTSLVQWRYVLGDEDGDGRRDLLVVRTAGGSSGRVEVTMLAAASSFRAVLHRTATVLAAPASAAWQWSAR